MTAGNISVFNNVKHLSNGGTMDILSYLYAIKNGRWNNEIIDYRNNKIEKIALPLATICGVFSYRSIAGLVEPSGFICIDIDDIDPVVVKQQLAADKYTFAAWKSVGGKGVAAVFKINPKKHAESFLGLSEYLFSTYGIVVDPSGKDVSRARFVSTDHELFINEGSAKFAIYPPPKKKALTKLPQQVFVQSDFDEIVAQVADRGVDLVDSYFDWVTVAFALSDKFGEAGRGYFHTLSGISHKYSPDKCDKQYSACLNHKGTGITIASFYYMAKQAGIVTVSAKPKLIGTTAFQAKTTGRWAESAVQLLLDLERSPADISRDVVDQVFNSNIEFEDNESILEDLMIYLRQNYTFRRNELTRKIENSGVPMETKDLNTVFINTKKAIDKTSFELMERVINSDFTQDYNPLTEFIQANRHRQPSGLIVQLCNSIRSSQPKEYKELFITKWLVGIVESIEGDFSPLMLVLSGSRQGTGKTEWFRRLLPRDIRSYYAESKLDAGKDDEILMTSKLLIVDDEMGGKSKKETARLKELTSKKWFSLREPYGRHNVDLRRLAVLGGTSNDSDLLNDPTGNRRIIPIEVIDYIDKELYNSIDKTDLLMEVYHLHKSGFTSVLSKEEIEYLASQTEDFQAPSVERELLMAYYELPPDDLHREFLTTSEIKARIEMQSGQRLNINKLGQELKKCGFERVSKGKRAARRYGYYVKRRAIQ